jgi:hypothetical protein
LVNQAWLRAHGICKVLPQLTDGYQAKASGLSMPFGGIMEGLFFCLGTIAGVMIGIVTMLYYK